MMRFFKRRRWLGRGLLLALVPMTAAACHGRHHQGHHNMSEDQMRENIDDDVDFVLGRVDATDDQKARVKSALEQAVPDMLAFRQERKALATDLHIALRKQDIDRDELETLRARGMELANRASVRGMVLLADVADELTPEQRQRLVSEWKRRTGA